MATAPGVCADIPATEGRDEVTPEFRQEAYSSKRISEEKRKNNTEKKSMCEPLLEYYYKIKISFNDGHKEFIRQTQNKEYVLG